MASQIEQICRITARLRKITLPPDFVPGVEAKIAAIQSPTDIQVLEIIQDAFRPIWGSSNARL